MDKKDEQSRDITKVFDQMINTILQYLIQAELIDGVGRAIFKSLNLGIGTSALGLESEMELELLLISQTSLFPVP